MPSASKIGYDLYRVVEAEVRRKLETVSGNRDIRRHQRYPVIQKTDHGGSNGGGLPPQIGRRPPMSCGLCPGLLDRFASSSKISPSPSRQYAVRKSSAIAHPAEGRACKARGHFPAPRRQQIANEIETSAPFWREVGTPVEDGRAICFLSASGSGMSAGNLEICARQISLAPFAAPHARDRRGNRKRMETVVVEPHSSPMNISGGMGASRVTASAAASARLVRLRREAIAQRTIADLVVVLQKIDKGRWRQRADDFAARPPIAVRSTSRPDRQIRKTAMRAMCRRGRTRNRGNSPAFRQSAAHARHGDSHRSIARGYLPVRRIGYADRAGLRDCRRSRGQDGSMRSGGSSKFAHGAAEFVRGSKARPGSTMACTASSRRPSKR